MFVPDGGTEAVLASINPDVIIDLVGTTDAIVPGSPPRYGLWSVQLARSGDDDVDPSNDVVPGSGVAVVSFVARLGRVQIVLRRAALPVIPYSYGMTLSMLQKATACWPAECLAWLRDYGAFPAPSPVEEQPQTPFAPLASGRAPSSLRTIVGIKRRHAARWMRHLVDHLLWSDAWSVGIADADIAAFVDGAQGRVDWLPSSGRASAYHADPFGIVDGGSTVTILAERFDYSTGRGTLQSVAVNGGASAEWSADLELRSGIHLSYPYLLRDEGTIYCIPETHQAREIALYRATSFPLGWEKDTVLISDFAGVDPTVVRVAGRWWLFATDHDDDAWSALHAWWATELRGPWQPHARNPIKVDVRSSRPAGTPYISGRRLLRPAQDNSRGYGTRIVVNSVTSLSPTRFAEEPAAVVEPSSRWPWNDGIHTITALGDRTLFDAKRRAVIPVASWGKARDLARVARGRH